MKRKLFFISPFLNSWNVAAFPELIRREKKTSDVGLLYCNAQQGRCYNNIYSSKTICSECTKNAVAFAKREFPELELIPVFRPNFEGGIKRNPESSSLVDYSAVSTLVSRFRPVQNNWSKREKKFYHLLKDFGNKFVDALNSRLTELTGSTKIVIFNGRVFPGALVRTSRLQFENIECDTFEYCEKGDQIYYFKNSTAHDLPNARREIAKISRVGLTTQQKERAHEFFARAQLNLAKRLGNSSIETSTDFSRKTISIFLSSDDELASLGPDWESIFTNDVEHSVVTLCEMFHDYNILLRLHPNQAGQGKRILKIYKAIAKSFYNVKIIFPNEKINSYGLINYSDFVISFGSTISVEATYLGKISILLGKQRFDSLDVAYTPKSFNELESIIRSQREIKPKSIEAALVYGYFCDRPGIELPNVKFQDAQAYFNGNPLIENVNKTYLIMKLIDHLRLRRPDMTFTSLLRLVFLKLNFYDLKNDRMKVVKK